MEFWRYYGILRRRWWVPALMALLAIVTVTGLLLFRPPTYASTATMMVRTPGASNSVLIFTPSGGGTGLTDQVTLIKTDVVTMISSPAFFSRVAARFPGRVIPGTYTATAVPNTSLLNISARAATPQSAQQVADAVTGEFVRFYRDLNRSDAAESRAFLGQQVERARARLDGTDDRLQQYRASKGLPALDEQITRAVTTLAQFETDRDMADVTARQDLARVAAARRALAAQSATLVSAETLVENPTLQQLRGRLTQLEMDLTTAQQVYTNEHPRVIQLRGEIASMRARLPQEVARVVGSQTVSTNPLRQRLLEDVVTQTVDYTSVVARRDALETATRRLRAQLPNLTTAQRQLASLVREQRAAEESYGLLSSKLNEAIIKEQQAAYETVSLRMVNAPLLPTQPVAVPRVLMLAAALSLGLMLGVGGAFVVDYLDGTVRTPAEAGRVLGVNVLGVIPTMNRRVYRQLTTPARPAWQTATFVLVIVAVVAAAVMLGVRSGVAHDLVGLWTTLRAAW